MTTIVETIGAPSLSQAASALGTTHQNVKQIAGSLERKGFLRIAPDEHDGRVRRLSTTVKSRRYWQRRSGSDHQLVLEWFSGLDPREAETLFHLLLRLEASIRASLKSSDRA